MKQYYLAVDGGGTKTDYALVDSTGTVVDRYQGPGSNHEGFPDGYDGAIAELQLAINILLQRNNLKIRNIGDAVLGLAGMDHEYQKREMEQRLRSIGLSRFLVCNDGFLSVKSETGQGIGIAYNCGTGVCCDAINEAGEMLQLGGLGWDSNDLGGGSVILQKVFSGIYDDVIMGVRKTLMSKLYYDAFSLHSCEEFYDSIRLLVEDQGDSRRKAIQVLFLALEQDDPVALEICNAMVFRGAQFISTAYRKLQFNKVAEVVLTGSMHTKAGSPRYIAMFQNEIEKQLPGNTICKVAANSPVMGAVRWLVQRNML